MNRPDPIEYAEHLYDAICAANFSPISFLAFGNAVKDGVPLRNLPRIAVEPFMRIVGEMLDLEEEAGEDDGIFDAELTVEPQLPPAVGTNGSAQPAATVVAGAEGSAAEPPADPAGNAQARTVDQAPAVEAMVAPNVPAAEQAAEASDAAATGTGERRRNGKRG
jgi:hypothetical protein